MDFTKWCQYTYCFIVSPMQCDILATYPPFILTIFETTDASRCLGAYNCDNFKISVQALKCEIPVNVGVVLVWSMQIKWRNYG